MIGRDSTDASGRCKRPSNKGSRSLALDRPTVPIAEPQIRTRRRLVTTACMLAIFMAAVEATIVATAMPTIVGDLGGARYFTWVFSTYLLMQAISTPIYGRLADIHGRKRVFLAGAAVFIVGSAAFGVRVRSGASLVVTHG